MSELRASLKSSDSQCKQWREYATRLLKRLNDLEPARMRREFDKIMNATEWSD